MRAPLGQVRGPIVVAAGVTLLLLTGALHDGHAEPSRALPPQPAEPLAVSVPDVAADLSQQGITLTAGWRPDGLLGAADPWSLLDPSDGVRPWLDELPRVRINYDAGGRLFVEDAVVVADPAHCYHLARIVRSVGVGIAPPAGPLVAAQLEAWLEPPYFSGVRSPVGPGPCSGAARTQWGFAIEQAEPLPCVVPGRDVACFTLAKWRYDFGPRDLWTSTHRTFDVTTGERLDDGDLHPGLDLAAFDALVEEAVCGLGGRCDGLPVREGRVHPTRTALAVEFSPGEAAEARHGSLRLTVPRRALPLSADLLSSGPLGTGDEQRR